jgi:nucleoside-diphosphate-sugar epimerase
MKLGIANLPLCDLDLICAGILRHRASLQEREILVYGGTGFVGTWLVASLLHANRELDLHSSLTVVTRNVVRAQKRLKVHRDSKISFIEHDLAAGVPKELFTSDIIYHAATPTMLLTGSENSKAVVASTLNGALHAISLKSKNSDKPLVIHLSSGAVFGVQPMAMKLRLETDSTVLKSESPYTQAKLMVEHILSDACQAGKIHYQSPRLFAFGGPLIPTNEHFAIGNFLRDGLEGNSINLTGSSATLRSYMYPADLINTLINITCKKDFQNFNIGSDVPISMSNLATLISSITSKQGIRLSEDVNEPSNYVPDISNVKSLPGHSPFMSIGEALDRWVEWLKSV